MDLISRSLHLHVASLPQQEKQWSAMVNLEFLQYACKVHHFSPSAREIETGKQDNTKLQVRVLCTEYREAFNWSLAAFLVATRKLTSS
jgi:hypothetical protein